MYSHASPRVRTAMGRMLCGSLLGLAILGLLTQSRSALAATPEEVDLAIKKGQQFLLSKQKESGGWENDPQRQGEGHDWEKMQGGTFGGFTSLCTYALLASGVSPQESHLVKAIEFLKKADVFGNYALGMRSNVWLLLPQTKENSKWLNAAIKHDKDLLLDHMSKATVNSGLWDYGRKSPRIDHSVSQYGVLGLWALEQAGAEIDNSVWKTIDERWRAQQYENGGWAYDGTGKDAKPPSPSMTAAGVATLFITQDYLAANRGLDCKGNISNDNIENGLLWMSKNFGAVSDTYSWYGVERIGVASGYKYFGTADWYQVGAERLVRAQVADGHWDSTFPGSTPLTASSFALLFMSRGRAPVMMNKLDYVLNVPGHKPVEGNWNQRPRDVANLARWAGKSIESDLNWQIVNLQVPVTELFDSPILYITGDQELLFSAPEIEKLKGFVVGGGMILGNADCASDAFTKSFEKLGETMLGRPFRELPPNHPIFTDQQFHASKWTKIKPKLRALTNDVREQMVLMPDADASRAWQTRSDQTKVELFQLGSDIFQYAVDKKNLSYKGQTHIVLVDPKINADRPVTLARLQVGTNWDPEPGAWTRMSAIMHNRDKVAITLRVGKPTSSTLVGAKIAHLTGTGKFQFTADERDQLLEFTSHGGTLVVDAAGGAGDFADAAEVELKTLFGKDGQKGLVTPLPADHLLYAFPENKMTVFGYRTYARKLLVGSAKVPRVRGIVRNGRIICFYSREDLTAGMVGEPVDGLYGYDPATATGIMRNIVLYSAFGPPKPAPPPPPVPATQQTAVAPKK